MNKRWMLVGVTGLLVALLLASIASAQSSTRYSLAWYVLGGGGGRVASTNYAMNSTVGQAAVGLSSSASYRMLGGYWQNWPDYRVFLPLVLRGA
jgi:hypothetical protein